jgi:CheY-like chemotaxis protein
LNRRTSDAENSVKTGYFGIKNPTKSNYKSSCFVSEIVGENDEKNKSNINNNNKDIAQNDLSKLEKIGVTIEYSKDPKVMENSKISNNYNLKNSKNLVLSEIEDFENKKRNSQNLDDKLNQPRVSKDAMTFFDKPKLNNLKESITVIDDNVLQNKNLFLDATKERLLYLQEIGNKTHKDLSKGSESIKHDIISEENEESVNPSEEVCNCADLLVVDDEEFNVMASQKMFLKLGHLTDKAYNGQECIDLIVQKGKSSCKCGKNYYKIIFLDIVMPIMDGIKTAHKVQEMIDNKETNENIKIVFVSGNIDGPDLKKSLLEINCVKECLQKPVQIAKYQKILEKYYQNE